MDELEKYKMPSKLEIFSQLGKMEFEDENELDVVIDKLSDKVNTYIKFLEDVLQPDSNITSMTEASVFTNEERNELYSILKTLLYWDRLYLEIDLNPNDESKAEYFKKYFEVWKDVKKLLKPLLNKAIEVWKNSIEETKFEGYFG